MTDTLSSTMWINAIRLDSVPELHELLCDALHCDFDGCEDHAVQIVQEDECGSVTTFCRCEKHWLKLELED